MAVYDDLCTDNWLNSLTEAVFYAELSI